MTRLLYFSSTQEMRRDGISMCLGMEKGGGVYIVVVEKIWIKGHLMRVNKGPKGIMNLDPISDFGES